MKVAPGSAERFAAQGSFGFVTAEISRLLGTGILELTAPAWLISIQGRLPSRESKSPRAFIN